MSKPEDPPVSVKAALRCGDRWVLLRNERNEWELPGGRIDADDASLRAVLRRECSEELGVTVQVAALLDVWLFEVVPGKRVTIVCFEASCEVDQFVLSEEHNAVGVFSLDELDDLDLAPGYRTAINAAATRNN